jgi:hypothetical protein
MKECHRAMMGMPNRTPAKVVAMPEIREKARAASNRPRRLERRRQNDQLLVQGASTNRAALLAIRFRNAAD